MIIPPYLKHGDTIGIVAPAGQTAGKKVEKTVEKLEKAGYKTLMGKNIFNRHFKYAGSDEERYADLQSMLDNNQIKAILCARGGYGLIRIINRLNFENFTKNPKWIIGFSDITILHAQLNNQLDICSIHGPMCREFFSNDETSVQLLLDCLTGKLPGYKIKAHPLNIKGKAKGRLTGGNLAILTSLTGSISDFDPAGKILFIEDIGEPLYKIDRMMWSLQRAGKLDGLAGLVAGQFTEMTEDPAEFGKNTEEIILEHVKDKGYPVMFGFPAGHGNPNYPLVMNAECSLEVSKDGSSLRFG